MGSIGLGKLRQNVFDLSGGHNIDMSRDFVGEVNTLLGLGSKDLVKIEIERFFYLSPDRMVCEWGAVILSHHQVWDL